MWDTETAYAAVATARLLFGLSEEAFLRQANQRARTRLFRHDHYVAFCLALVECIQTDGPYYRTEDAGSVAKAYRYATTTAQWGVWRSPYSREVCFVVHRTSANGSVRCPYPGGKRSYLCEWAKAKKGRKKA